MCSTETALGGMDGLQVQLGYSQSLTLFTLLAASSGAMVAAGPSASPLGTVVRMAGSSVGGMLGVGSGIGVSTAGCGLCCLLWFWCFLGQAFEDVTDC